MDLISEIADKLGFNKVDLATHLLNRSLVQLKADSQKAGGFEKLEFTLRNNQQHFANSPYKLFLNIFSMVRYIDWNTSEIKML